MATTAQRIQPSTVNPATRNAPTPTATPTKMAAPVDVATTPSTPAPTPEVLPAGKEGKEAKKPTGAKRPRKEAAPADAKKNAGAEENTADGAEKAEAAGTQFLIVAKSVRTFLKNLPQACHCGADALPTLNQKVTELLIEASMRAHLNGRKTLKICDF